MSEFPRLRTGVVAQYPAARATTYSTRVFRFLDGQEQRYREHPAPLRRWSIRVELLNEDEMAGLREFFQAAQGSFGSFAFEDPWDGTTYADCSLEQDELVVEWAGEGRSGTVLVVRENRT